MEIRVIETHYKGYRFRSRLEARWAVFFDALNIKWEYEKDGFQLEDKTRYLPDFWLPQVEMWAEVKPEKFTREELRKAILLCGGTKRSVLLLDGIPNPQPYLSIEYCTYLDKPTARTSWSETENNFEWPTDELEARLYCGYCLSMYHNYPIDEGRFFYSPGFPEAFEDTKIAIEASRSARFEFGESG